MRWLFLVMLGALPLQWFVVAQTPLGVGRLHQLVALIFAVVVFLRYRSRAFAPPVKVMLPFAVSMTAMLTIWTATSIYNGQGVGVPIQEFIFFLVGGAVALFVYRAATGSEYRAIELMRWAAVVAPLTLVAALALSMLRNGVNPANAFASAISSGNPEILQKELFRASFAGFGLDAATVQGNIRHEVFGALLLAMEVSGWAVGMRPPTSTRLRTAFRIGIIVGALLLLTSLSRSVLLAALVWPALVGVRAVIRMRLPARHLGAAFVALALLAAGLVSGFGLVLWNRFTTDTSSYQARTQLLNSAASNIQTHLFTGGVDTVSGSSHNFVLDAWLRGGLFTMLPALFALGSLLVIWGVLLWRIGRSPGWMVPVTAAMALPIVRMFTSGGGLIPPVSWVALGFVAGVLASRLVPSPPTGTGSAESPTLTRSTSLRPVSNLS